MEMDDNLKKLMKKLGTAINESLAESESVSGAISDIRDAGYDVFLILEATIGFHQRQEGRPNKDRAPVASGDLVLNNQDAQFLKSLRITLTGSDEPFPTKND